MTVVVLVVVLFFLRWVAKLVQEPSLLEDWRYAYIFAVLLVGVKLLTDANRTSSPTTFSESGSPTPSSSGGAKIRSSRLVPPSTSLL